MEQDGSFFLKNLGKSSMFLNGKEIATGQAGSLSSSSLIEVCWFYHHIICCYLIWFMGRKYALIFIPRQSNEPLHK